MVITMTVTEKAAYLKGVVSMLKLEENSDEAKVLNVLVDTIDEMAQSIAELEEQLDLTNEQLDAVDEDLDDLEEYVYGDDDDDCCCDDDDMYEVECPSCGETVYFDGAAIEDALPSARIAAQSLTLTLTAATATTAVMTTTKNNLVEII